MVLNIITSTILCAILAVCIRAILLDMIPDIAGTFKELYPGKDTEFNNAIQELHLAEQQFNYADQKHIDHAIYRRKAAEERLQSLVREKKVI